MESQPQNPEFRNNPENFHSYISSIVSSALKIYFLQQIATNLYSTKLTTQMIFCL